MPFLLCVGGFDCKLNFLGTGNPGELNSVAAFYNFVVCCKKNCG